MGRNEAEIGQISLIVSGAIGGNHSLTARVVKVDVIGVRTVMIQIEHEGNLNGEFKERISIELADASTKTIQALSDSKYSVTEPDNITAFKNGDNRGSVAFRSSLRPIEDQKAAGEELPPTEEQSISVETLNPDAGPAVIWT